MTKAEEMETLHRLTKSFDSELTEEEEADMYGYMMDETQDN